MGDTLDMTWAIGDAMIWSNVEPCIGIVSACLPTIRPVLRRFNILWCGSSNSHNRRTGSTDGAPRPSPSNGLAYGRTAVGSNRSVQLKSVNKPTFRPDDDEVFLTTDVGGEDRDEVTTNSSGSGHNESVGNITVNHTFQWSVANVDRR